MATFDQLSPEQRAVIELVLKQGQSYAQLGELLGMDADRVSELARSALRTLSPVSAAEVDERWRGPIVDYLLGQQSEREAATTRNHLCESEAGRAWARSLLDSLYEFYDPAEVPSIPAGGAAAPLGPEPAATESLMEVASAEADKGTPAGVASPEPDQTRPAGKASAVRDAVVRRRLLGVVALVLVVALAAALVWPVGLLTGGDDKDKAARADTDPRIIGELVLRPLKGQREPGVAAIAQRDKQRTLIVDARLRPTQKGEAYGLWLYNSNAKARALGFQVTDRAGNFEVATELPQDLARFAFIDISREQVNGPKGHSGQSVLRGRIADFVAPPPTGQQRP